MTTSFAWPGAPQLRSSAGDVWRHTVSGVLATPMVLVRLECSVVPGATGPSSISTSSASTPGGGSGFRPTTPCP
eukprot:3613361-Lingulodinium_polyedra.AAC.1